MGVVLYGNDDLHHTIHTLDHELDQLKFGNTTADIPPPPTQAVSDALFQVGDKWAIEKQLLLGTADAAGVDHIVEAESLFMDASVVLVSAMIDAAWDADKTVQGTKISTAGNQVMLIEKMLKEATLIVMQHSSTTTENLMATIHDYERGFELLMGGNMGAHGSGSGSSSGRRLAATLTSKTDVPATAERAIVYQMNSVQEKFNVLKAKLDKVIESGTATADELTAMVSKAHYVESEMDEALVFYVSHTRTTTSVPIDVLAPLPLTDTAGGWDAGRTMRVSAMIAEGLINDEQVVMPGYGIFTAFYDDKCDTQTGTQVVLEQVASNDAYVGLTGMGCSEVCESTAFVASSMRMPFLSYECAGNDLSDISTYPDFTRMGTTTSNVPALIKEFSDMWSWDNIVIVSGDPSVYRAEAEHLQAALVDLGIMTDYVNSYDTEWLQIKEMMAGLKTQKKRYLYVMSTESFFRKVICGSILAEANIGITWLSEGTRHHEWWKDADPELLAHAADATCVFMYTIKHLLLHEGKTIDEIRRPNEDTYNLFVNHIKTGISFNGVSGKVQFMGNDKPAYLAVRQVREGAELLVGAKYMNSSADLTINDGPSNESWNPAFPDPPPPASNFPYWAFQAFVPIMCVCCPAIAGCIRST